MKFCRLTVMVSNHTKLLVNNILQFASNQTTQNSYTVSQYWG